MKRTYLAAVAATILAALAATIVAQPPDKPAATVELSGGSLAAGVGIDWATGVLHYDGRDVPIDVKGVSFARVGASTVTASGEVYQLTRLSDFAGTYSAVSAGAAFNNGRGVTAMQNDQGVMINLRSTAAGMDLDLGVKALQVSLAR